MIGLGVRAAVCLAAAALTAGCAHRTPRTLAERFVHTGARDPSAGPPVEWNLGDTKASKELPQELKARLHEMMSKAPPPRDPVATVENRDPDLRAARLALTLFPTAESHRLVGEAYARLGVLDAAYDQFEAALRLDPHDASSYDALARIWRDWGFPHLGLVDAYRAIYYAPDSAAARNTLGTLLLKMGQTSAARDAFEKALRLDPNASYARANLSRLPQVSDASSGER